MIIYSSNITNSPALEIPYAYLFLSLSRVFTECSNHPPFSTCWKRATTSRGPYKNKRSPTRHSHRDFQASTSTGRGTKSLCSARRASEFVSSTTYPTAKSGCSSSNWRRPRSGSASFVSRARWPLSFVSGCPRSSAAISSSISTSCWKSSRRRSPGSSVFDLWLSSSARAPPPVPLWWRTRCNRTTGVCRLGTEVTAIFSHRCNSRKILCRLNTRRTHLSVDGRGKRWRHFDCLDTVTSPGGICHSSWLSPLISLGCTGRTRRRNWSATTVCTLVTRDHFSFRTFLSVALYKRNTLSPGSTSKIHLPQQEMRHCVFLKNLR